MFAKKLALAALLVATATGFAGAADLPVKAAKAAPPPPPFFFVNDNFLSYHYEFTATNPAAGKTPKNVASFTHFDVWAYGTNFINIDWLKATSMQTPTSDGGSPYTEIYGFARSTFGWNEIFNTKMFSYGPLTDISFMVGADGNVDNTFLASAKKSIEGGLTFSFAAPYHGFFNLSPNAYKEWQHDGFAVAFGAGTNPSGNVSFNTVAAVEWLYVQPLGFLPPSIPLTFKAFGTVHGPKGCGEACGGPVAQGFARGTELYSQENLELDAGKVLGYRPGMYSVWAGFRYWKNKFGILAQQTPVAAANSTGILTGITESTWLVGASVAF
jgi:hypothetical protein